MGQKSQKISIFGSKATAWQAPTPSRGDLTHKSAVMYDQIRATRLNVKGKLLALNLLLLLLLRALPTAVLSRFRANMKSGLSKMQPNRSKSSLFCNVGGNHQECSILEAKLTACQAPTPSRGDLTHKSAVMYDRCTIRSGPRGLTLRENP